MPRFLFLAPIAIAIALALGLPAPVGAGGPTPTFHASTRFSVAASRYVFTTRRVVSVAAHVEGLAGSLSVELDRPVATRLGVTRLGIEVRVIDAAGSTVDRLHAQLGDGERSFSLPFRLPSPGRYRLLVEDADLDAAPARLAILPDGVAFLDIDAPPSTTLR